MSLISQHVQPSYINFKLLKYPRESNLFSRQLFNICIYTIKRINLNFHPESPSDSSIILSPIADLKLGSILLYIISFSSKLSVQNRLGPLITILSTPKSIPDIITKLKSVKFSKLTTFLSKMISIRVHIAIEINKMYGSSQINPTKNISAEIRLIKFFLEMSRKDTKEKRGGFKNVRPNMRLKQFLLGQVENIFNLMANVNIIKMLTKPKSDEVYQLFVTLTMGFQIFSSLMASGWEYLILIAILLQYLLAGKRYQGRKCPNKCPITDQDIDRSPAS